MHFLLFGCLVWWTQAMFQPLDIWKKLMLQHFFPSLETTHTLAQPYGQICELHTMQ